ncbi:MAG: DUF5666 domain-containing protein [Pseudomonadota bacterium]
MRTTPRGSWRTACLILLLGLALAGCSVFQREDPRSDPSALGQAITGGEEEDEETDGGLGGTGILGAITGFGSIKVNGLRVRHASEATVLSVIGPRPVETLEVGEVLLAQAREADRGLLASRLVRYLPLVGPITALDLDTRSLRVLGVTVRVREGAVIRDRSGATLALVGLPLQGKLAVSGFWDGSAVVAHHLRVVAPELPDSVTGPVSVDAEGGLRIGGVAIEAGSAAPPVDGLALTATGQFRAGALAASRIEAGFATPLAPGIAKLSVQGYPQAETETETETETAAAVRLSGQPGIMVETGAVGRFGLFEGPVSALEGRDDRSGLPGTARSRLAERALPEISIASVPGAIRDRLDVSRAPVGALSAGATPIGAGVVGAGVLGSGVVGTGAVGRGVVGRGAIGSGAIGDAIGAGAVSPDAAGRGARGRAGGRGRGRSDDSAENGPGDTASGPGSGRGGPASGPGGGRGGPSGGPAGGRGGPAGGPAGGRGGPSGGPAGGRGGPAGGPAGGRGGPSGGPSGRGGPAGGPGGRGGPGGGAGPGNR